jgi:hypothetical protein
MELSMRREPWRIGGAAIIVGAAFLVGGCRGSQSKEPDDPGFASHHGKLQLSRKTADEDLRAELARLDQEGATPQHLTGLTPPFDSRLVKDRAGAPTATGDDGAGELAAVFTRAELASALKKLSQAYPDDGRFTHETLQIAAHVRLEFEPHRERFRRAARAPQCDFGPRFSEGILADFSYIDVCQSGCRLEVIYAAEQLLVERPEAAIACIETIFRACQWLDAQKHSVPRLAAAQIRQHTLRIVAAVAEHPDTTRGGFAALRNILGEQLVNWPPDQNAWIGERSDGLHAYELIRAGYLESVLTKKEIEHIKAEHDDYKLVFARMREGVDRDEYFFLRTMRNLVAACQSKPYHERANFFDTLDTELKRRRMDEKNPSFADLVLLKDLDNGYHNQAADLARCRAWWLALSLALGQTAPTPWVNPLTGRAFPIDASDHRVRVYELPKFDADIDISMAPTATAAAPMQNQKRDIRSSQLPLRDRR